MKLIFVTSTPPLQMLHFLSWRYRYFLCFLTLFKCSWWAISKWILLPHYVVMCFLAVQDKLNVSEEAAPQTFTHIRHMSPVPAKSLFRTESSEWMDRNNRFLSVRSLCDYSRGSALLHKTKVFIPVCAILCSVGLTPTALRFQSNLML